MGLPGDIRDSDDATNDTEAEHSSEVISNSVEDVEGEDKVVEHKNASMKFLSTKFRMCSHYRQLTTSRVAEMATDSFVPDKSLVDRCCAGAGGEQSRFGTHDIEDLVQFGVNPYNRSGIAIYRQEITSTFGLTLEYRNGMTVVNAIVPDGPTALEGSLKKDDIILAVNGVSVRGWPLAQVVAEVHKSERCLVLDISRVEGAPYDEEYSPNSACPYYLSQALSKDAELLFAPYNYVLEPSIRKALGIDIEGSVVCLDEAHNIEDTLKEGGSGLFGEIELMELAVMLSNLSIMPRKSTNIIEKEGGEPADPPIFVPDVAHSILLFVERVILVLRQSKCQFPEANVIEEYRKNRFKFTDDYEFELDYFGPKGHGIGGRAVGCKPFFQQIMFSDKDGEVLVTNTDLLDKHLRSNMNDDSEALNALLDRLVEFVSRFCFASKQSE